jgi:hypothetical protein
LGLIILTQFSCQKEIDSEIISDPINPGTGNAGNYQPLTPGTWWKYLDTASGNFIIMTALNSTKTINNVVFRAFKSNLSQTDTAYYASPAPNYYLYQKGVSPNTGAPYDLIFNFLNDTASVGYSWTYNAGSGNGFTAIHTVTIIEKGLTLNVQGHSYPDVIHTRLDFAYDLGTIMNLGIYNFYTAKGVGIVRVRAELPGLQTCSDLVEYHIQ